MSYFAIPFELVLTLTVLYFLPVNTFNLSLTPLIAFFVNMFVTLTVKYLPDAELVVNFDGLNVRYVLAIGKLFNLTEFGVRYFDWVFAVKLYFPGLKGTLYVTVPFELVVSVTFLPFENLTLIFSFAIPFPLARFVSSKVSLVSL